jgi:hypothetical protein
VVCQVSPHTWVKALRGTPEWGPAGDPTRLRRPVRLSCPAAEPGRRSRPASPMCGRRAATRFTATGKGGGCHPAAWRGEARHARVDPAAGGPDPCQVPEAPRLSTAQATAASGSHMRPSTRASLFTLPCALRPFCPAPDPRRHNCLRWPGRAFRLSARARNFAAAGGMGYSVIRIVVP